MVIILVTQGGSHSLVTQDVIALWSLKVGHSLVTQEAAVTPWSDAQIELTFKVRMLTSIRSPPPPAATSAPAVRYPFSSVCAVMSACST